MFSVALPYVRLSVIRTRVCSQSKLVRSCSLTETVSFFVASQMSAAQDYLWPLNQLILHQKAG
jgi:hypothetical protein